LLVGGVMWMGMLLVWRIVLSSVVSLSLVALMIRWKWLLVVLGRMLLLPRRMIGALLLWMHFVRPLRWKLMPVVLVMVAVVAKSLRRCFIDGVRGLWIPRMGLGLGPVELLLLLFLEDLWRQRQGGRRRRSGAAPRGLAADVAVDAVGTRDRHRDLADRNARVAAAVRG
jgi:hypothetical protein